MPQAALLLDEAEPLPLPPPPKAPRLARGSMAPPPMLDPEIIGVQVLEHPAPAEWGPIERVSLRERVDRIALSLVCGLGTMAALLAVALLA
jgi:hypothetical protein